jgi:hypothetical protein
MRPIMPCYPSKLTPMSMRWAEVEETGVVAPVGGLVALVVMAMGVPVGEEAVVLPTTPHGPHNSSYLLHDRP